MQARLYHLEPRATCPSPSYSQNCRDAEDVRTPSREKTTVFGNLPFLYEEQSAVKKSQLRGNEISEVSIHKTQAEDEDGI
jgi:hypothetical protein